MIIAVIVHPVSAGLALSMDAEFLVITELSTYFVVFNNPPLKYS